MISNGIINNTNINTNPSSFSGQKSLIKYIENIKNKINRKKALTKKISDLKSKILLDNQINQEIDRRIEENDFFLKEQSVEFNTNIQKKNSLILQLEKKFIEVEIFAHREFKGKSNNPFIHSFNLHQFFSQNEKNILEIKEFKQISTNYVADMINIKKDNIKLHNPNYLIDIKNNDKVKKLEKLKKLLEVFKVRNIFLEKRKDYFNKLINKFMSSPEEKQSKTINNMYNIKSKHLYTLNTFSQIFGNEVNNSIEQRNYNNKNISNKKVNDLYMTNLSQIKITETNQEHMTSQVENVSIFENTLYNNDNKYNVTINNISKIENNITNIDFD